MPYRDNFAFTKPDDENVKVWRYMDFTKFVSLLDKRALFFCRVEKLTKVDPFEGSYPEFNAIVTEIKLPPNVRKALRSNRMEIQKWILLNCWHINEYESAAMWRLYLQSNEGIAIQSTFKRLSDSFKDVQYEINIGRVNYIDYEKEWIPEESPLYPLLHKRKSFEHEQELRAITVDGYLPEHVDGKYVPVDIDRLIERIFVSPTSQSWFSELVRSVATKYDTNKEIRVSKLSEKPIQ